MLPSIKFLASTSTRALLDFPSLNWDMILAGLELDEAEGALAEPLLILVGVAHNVSLSLATLISESSGTTVTVCSSVEFWEFEDARLPALQLSPPIIA